MFDSILKDPRLVKKKIGGKEYKFWFHRAGSKIALDDHGYDMENAGDDIDVEAATLQDTFDLAMRQLWIAHLIFENVSYEEFDLRFLPSDGQDLADAYAEMLKKQTVSFSGGKETKGKSKPKK